VSQALNDVIALLKPSTVYAKSISAAGNWAVRYSSFGHPSFAVILEGHCRLDIEGHAEIELREGDFVLLPTTPAFVMSGGGKVKPVSLDPHKAAASGEVRHGRRGGKPDVRQLGGYFAFESADAALLVSLLPPVLHVRGVERLATLVRLIRDESADTRSGRELVLARLVEVMLIEALRAAPGEDASPGLLRGLADARLATAMRHMHDDPARAWTVEQLARKAALSRSAFFDRFTRAVGVAPMEYLLSWRMALAKDLLRKTDLGLEEVAERVGYGSASTFSTAFSRHVGQPPGRFARAA